MTALIYGFTTELCQKRSGKMLSNVINCNRSFGVSIHNDDHILKKLAVFQMLTALLQILKMVRLMLM